MAVPGIQDFEPHLLAKDLRKAIVPLFPGVSGESSFARILPYLPYTLLPGARRRTYLLSEVVRALDSMASRFPAVSETPLHRRRGKQDSSPSMARTRRPRTAKAAS